MEISCALKYPGLINETVSAINAVLPANLVSQRLRPGCAQVGVYSMHLPCLFPQHGPGAKHTRKIVLEPWQKGIVDVYPARLVRGLIHSDGCRIMNRVRHMINGAERWYEYPRYFFTNESTDIRTIFTDALDCLGVAWKQSNRITISVARRDAVARLDEFVGPKH